MSGTLIEKRSSCCNTIFISGVRAGELGAVLRLALGALALAACSPAASGDPFVGVQSNDPNNTGGTNNSPGQGGATAGASVGGSSNGGSSAGTEGNSGTNGLIGGSSGAGGAASALGGSGGQTAGDAGPGPSGDACEIACDDFEGASIDSARWRVLGAAPELSTARARSGSQSVLFADIGQTGRFLTSVAPFPATGTLFLRAYMNFERATVDMAGHTGFIVGASGDDNSDELRLGQSQPGCVSQDQVLDLNHEPTDRTICSTGLVSGGNPNDFMNAGVTLEANRWYCVEVEFDRGAEAEFRLWIDEDEVEVLHATADSWCPPQQQNCGTPQPWPIQFSLVKFGTQVYNGSAGNIWYDDLALSTSPIGCD